MAVIIRTNLSTFWRLDKLYNFLYKIKKPYFCGGYLDNKGCIHITGTGIIFSKNIAILLSYFLNNKIKNINKPDDVLFTRILEKKFKIYHCIKRNEDFIHKDIIIKYNKNNKKLYTNINNNHFYFRLKTNYNRTKDNIKMYKLYKLYYKYNKYNK